eukprot:COSAG01_NODE_3800_length_5685_cov_4.802542_6_plen_134_part_00
MVDFLDIFLNLLMTLFYWHFAKVAYSFYLDLSGQRAQVISTTFLSFYHHDKNRRRNEHKCMGISVTALVLLIKLCCRARARASRRRETSECAAVSFSFLVVVVCVCVRVCACAVPPCPWVVRRPRVHAHGASM